MVIGTIVRWVTQQQQLTTERDTTFFVLLTPPEKHESPWWLSSRVGKERTWIHPTVAERKRKVSKGVIVLMVFLQHIYIYMYYILYMYICIHIYLNALRGCSEIRTLFCVVWQPCSLYMVWNGSWCSWLLSSPSQHPSKVVLLKWSPSCDVWLPGEPWASPPFIHLSTNCFKCSWGKTMCMSENWVPSGNLT